MPIVTIGIGDSAVSVFSALFIVWYVSVIWLSFRSNARIFPSREFISFSIFLALSLIASLVGLAYFNLNAEWTAKIWSYIPKVLLYFVLLLSITKLSLDNNLSDLFLKGFLLGCVANLVWSIIEGAVFYSIGIPLNDVVFSGYAKTLPEDRQYMTIVVDGIIRTSGFNTDPAHLGGIIPIVIVYGLYRRNIALVGTALVSLIFSGSTTALVTTLLTIAISPWRLSFSRLNPKKITISIILIVLALGGILTNDTAKDSLYRNAEGFYNRTTENYVENRNEGPRYVYHAYLLEAIHYNGIRSLTGTGFGTASFPYVDNPEIAPVLQQEHTPYDPESTYISYLFDVGPIGLAMYLITLIGAILKFRKKIRNGKRYQLIYSTLGATLFAGLFYHYILTAYQILIIILAISIICRDKANKHQPLST